MIAPVRLVGARAVFYRVKADAQADFLDLGAKVGPCTRALILTHFFGFPQDLEHARTFCDEHQLILIEDCAHAFFGDWRGMPVGSVGDYAIASSMKFFPVFDGGVLAAKNSDLSAVRLRQPSFPFELKALSNVIERALQYDRLVAVDAIFRLALKFKDKVWHLLKRRSQKIAEARYSPGSSEGGFTLDPEWLDVRMSWISRTILRFSNYQGIARGRRANYQYLLEHLGKVQGMHPMHPELPAGTVPLNFPVLVDQPATLFPTLKRAGVPIWRFGEFLDDEVTEEVCANSCHLSRHVFQFPCHSELRPAELSWMVDTILTHLSQITDVPAGGKPE
jgi:dTDP-4-amino-4,6-dideoxygalactose transaminase